MSEPTVVFVHGACVRDGAWWWRRTGERLAAEGVRSVAAALPSCGEAGVAGGVDGPGLAEDVEAVRAVLRDVDGPAVVVVHSYGGIVAAEALVGAEEVAHVLLISSYLARPGERLASFGGPEPAPFIAVDPDAGTLAVRPELLEATFLHDCPEVTAEATARLAPQSLAVVGTPVRASALAELPTTYLVCEADRGTPAAAQRSFAARAQRVVSLDAGHHPFLSRPAEVAELVLELRS